MLHSAILYGDKVIESSKKPQRRISIYFACPTDGVCRRILHFQSPQAISLHLSPSDVDFTPGFYNPLTVWTHYTAHIINTAYNVFLLVILGSIKSALLIRIADTVCLLWNSVRICYRFSITVSAILLLHYFCCFNTVVLCFDKYLYIILK